MDKLALGHGKTQAQCYQPYD